MKANKRLNHSAAHLLAAAVMKLYPDTILGIGPAIEEGFYYDFKFSSPINDQDLKKIEKQMSKLIAGGYKFELVEKDGLKDQPLKKELFDQYSKEKKDITYYGMINPSNGKSIHTEMCAGPHVESVGKIKHFKLLSHSAAYWRGDQKNESLTRIYGTAWETKEELENYLQLLKERKERDHRVIGKQMNLFMFDPLAGRGFPIWLPDGMILKNTIMDYVRKSDRKYGYKEVETPAFGEVKLYETSGHWQHYKDDMYPKIEVESENIVMRPMTCPHHILIYKRKRRSYKELPIRYSEQALLYRKEKSGALTGLERVRSMQLTEGHVFVAHEQIKKEIAHGYKQIMEGLKKFEIEVDHVALSLRDKNDKEKYFDNDQMWDKAENDLRQALDELKIQYTEEIGEAAFYGPKIDVQVKTALGHVITLSTLQLDFLLPQRFEITYIDANEEKVTPVLIHRGFLSTYERFIAILLEQSKGNLPFWLAPRQIVVLPVNEIHFDYANEVKKTLEEKGFRVEIDLSNERISKKIREYQIAKVKYQLVIGDEEVAKKTVTYRAYGSKEQKTIALKDFDPSK